MRKLFNMFRIYNRLESIDRKLTELLAQGRKIMADLTVLQAQVTANSTVIDSAIALIQGLAARIEELKTDPVALQALADELRTKDDQLSAAVVANTPVVPA